MGNRSKKKVKRKLPYVPVQIVMRPYQHRDLAIRAKALGLTLEQLTVGLIARGLAVDQAAQWMKESPCFQEHKKP